MPDVAGRWREALAFLLLAAIGFGRWWPELWAPFVRVDEGAYVKAAQLLLAGQSPYEEAWYFYPPTFALVGAQMVARLGVLPYLHILRLASLAGVCIAVWLSLRLAGWPRWLRLLLGLLLVLEAEAVRIGVLNGNVAGLAIGLVTAGLFLAIHRPLAGGSLLALGLVIKPVAPLAPLLLLFHRPPLRPTGLRRAGGAALVALVVLLLPGVRYLPQMLGNAGGIVHPRNIALDRLLYCFGLDPHPVVVLVLLAVVAVAFLRRFALDPILLLAFVLVVNLLALPIVWIYTTLLVLPVQMLALAAAWKDLRAWRPAGAQPDHTWALLTLVLLAVLGIFFSHAVGIIPHAPLWVQGLVVAVPVLAPAYLFAYLLQRQEAMERLGK